ncbi:MAG: GNAT family N-acetyltransferase [Alphaproteobacteria bacterium]
MTASVTEPVSEFVVLPETAGDEPLIENLLDEAFGPGRFAKTAYRLREGIKPLPDLSFTAKVDEALIGSIRYWPVQVEYADKPTLPALLLGPLVVTPTRKSNGVGLALMTKSLEAAKQSGHKTVILVGDEPYYSRVGFSILAGMGLSMPGPVDPTRLLALDMDGPLLDGTPGRIVKGA